MHESLNPMQNVLIISVNAKIYKSFGLAQPEHPTQTLLWVLKRTWDGSFEHPKIHIWVNG